MTIRARFAPLLVLLSLLPSCAKEQPSTPDEPKIAPSRLNATLRQAAFDGVINKVRAALEQGAEVDDPAPPHTDPGTPQTMAEGATALMLAAFMGHTETVAILLDNGANVDATDAAGRTPLMFCASGPYAQTVERLLQAGAEIDTRDKVEHFTALMFAASEGNISVVRTLLKHGADTEAVDIDGDSALSFARQNRHGHVAAVLEKAAKKD